ncbi:MAG: cytochrome c [Terracidiphilus sp.]
MIKPLFLIPAVILLTSASASGPAQPFQDGASAPGNAKMLYARDCAVCHGANGDGKTDIVKEQQFVLLDWTDPKSLSGMPDQYIFNLIRNGRGKMPAESVGRANNDEVHAMIKYIRTMAKDQAAASSGDKTPPAPNK